MATAGDRAQSAVYKDLLAIWSDADPNIPLIQAAKAKSAKL
jgi:hypothetical protein